MPDEIGVASALSEVEYADPAEIRTASAQSQVEYIDSPWVKAASAQAQAEYVEVSGVRSSSILSQAEYSEIDRVQAPSAFVQVEYYIVPWCVDTLSAVADSDSAITLSWTRDSDPHSFLIERADSAGGPWVYIDSVFGAERSYQDSGLDPGRLYFYRVRVFSGGEYSLPSYAVHAVTLRQMPVDVMADLLVTVVRSFRFDADLGIHVTRPVDRLFDLFAGVTRRILIHADTRQTVTRRLYILGDLLLGIRGEPQKPGPGSSGTRGQALDFLGKGLSFPFAFQRRSGGARISTATSADHAHIHESIRQILGTRKGERLMRPEFGTRLYELVFEPNDRLLYGLIRHEVVEALERWEPRIVIREVLIAPDETDHHLVLVHISYRLISSQVIGNMVYPFYRELE